MAALVGAAVARKFFMATLWPSPLLVPQRLPWETGFSLRGPLGGGSNYGGLAYPFIAGRLRGDTPDMRFLATEPAGCPTSPRAGSPTTSATRRS